MLQSTSILHQFLGLLIVHIRFFLHNCFDVTPESPLCIPLFRLTFWRYLIFSLSLFSWGSAAPPVLPDGCDAFAAELDIQLDVKLKLSNRSNRPGHPSKNLILSLQIWTKPISTASWFLLSSGKAREPLLHALLLQTETNDASFGSAISRPATHFLHFPSSHAKT